MSEVVAANKAVETNNQKRIRELASKTTLSNPEIQEAIQLLLKKEAKAISKARKPKP